MPVPSRPGNLAVPGPARISSPGPQTTPAASLETTAEFTDPRHTRTLIKVLSLLLLGAIAMAALLSLLPAAGHDQLWFLLVAQRWLAGATLYGPEIFDSNTPAIVWLSAIPTALAQHLHLPAIAIAKLLVLLLEAAVATLSLRLLRRLAPLARPQLLWLAFSFIVIFACAPARDLGQRDHLTALLCLPYVLAAAADALTLPATSPLRFAAGILAGIGICLKPQQALVPLAIELTLLLQATLHHPSSVLPQDQAPSPPSPHPNAVISTEGDAQQRRSGETCIGPCPSSSPSAPSPSLPASNPTASLRRPEPWLILLTALAFLAAIHHLTPLFFSLTLPTLLSTYWAIGHLSPLQLLAESPQLHLLALLTLALFLLRTPRPQTHLRRPTALLLLAGTAATAAFYLQGTGWYYQQLPAISLFAAALALELLPLLHPRPLPRWLPPATAALIALALGLTIHFGGLPLTHDAAYTTSTPDPALFTGLAPGTPVAILTTAVEDSMMPVARFHLTWAQRTNNLWTLPALLRQANPATLAPKHRLSPARIAALTAQQRRWMQEDLLRWHPALLLVARCDDPAHPCQNLEGLEANPALHPDLLTFFLADPALHTLLTTHYRLTRSTPAYNAYTLFSPF